MTKIVFFFTTLVGIVSAFAQEDIVFSISHVSYSEADGRIQHLTILNVCNMSDDTYCLWIEDSLKGKFSDENLMMRYFYDHSEGSSSLYSIMNDGNVGSVSYVIGQTFFKMLSPQETFSFLFIGEEYNESERVQQFIDKRLMIVVPKYLKPYKKNKMEYPLSQIVISCH